MNKRWHSSETTGPNKRSSSPRGCSPESNIAEITNYICIFMILMKLYTLLTKSKHHSSYLGTYKCITENNAPNGLSCKIEPHVPGINTEFIIKWERAHNEFGLILAALLQEYWTTFSSKLTEDIDKRKRTSTLM